MIRLKLRSQGDVFETLLAQERDDIGPEIRIEGQALCDASTSVAVDVPALCCHACETTVGDRIGLTREEITIISNWRERKELGYSSRQLGEILDKIVNFLDGEDPEGDVGCDRDGDRIVIEVEPTP